MFVISVMGSQSPHKVNYHISMKNPVYHFAVFLSLPEYGFLLVTQTLGTVFGLF